VQRQFEHHQAVPGDRHELPALCRFHSPQDAEELRKTAHGVFQYNVHFVFAVRRRCEFLDPYVAQALVEYWQHVCQRHDWQVWDLEVVWNHAHLYVGLLPSDSPQVAALSLLNNSEYFLQKRYGASLAAEGLDGIWRAGFYAGTAGAATTAQIRAYLERIEATGELG
jgi:putative transposase